MNKLSYEQALHRLATYCSHVERCEWDIRRKMEAWELPPEQQDAIVQRLRKEKFIDEERYCKAFVNDKTKYNHWGIHKIFFELKKKQLPESFIREALKNLDSKENLEHLRLLIAQKKKSIKGNNEWQIRQKLLLFAISRGFSPRDIEAVLGADNESDE